MAKSVKFGELINAKRKLYKEAPELGVNPFCEEEYKKLNPMVVASEQGIKIGLKAARVRKLAKKRNALMSGDFCEVRAGTGITTPR